MSNRDMDNRNDKGVPFNEGDELMAARYLASAYPIDVSDATRLIVEMLERAGDRDLGTKLKVVQYCRRVIELGVESLNMEENSVSFEEAMEAVMVRKNSARDRTINEMRQICQRLLAEEPEWCRQVIRRINTDSCQDLLQRVFDTVPMQRKARRVLHAVFAHGMLCGWCSGNPVDLVVLAPYREKPICALNLEEIKRLLRTMEKPEFRDCAVAVGLMLWAGIRPGEVMRLTHSCINFEERVITIPAMHSKTGGARQVNMYPALYYWLRRRVKGVLPETPVVPAAWNVRWCNLRMAAGFKEWVTDVLRHTFASYHLKYYRDLNTLVLDMGHSSPKLLHTRYLSMEEVTAVGARYLWEYGVPANKRKK